jgi:prepilin-type N-terminal cleavage/methylation domain-containing protein
MHKKSFSKGFSLVELMIVVAVIAILAAVAVPAYFNHTLRVRQTDAFHNLLDVKAAEEMFYSQYNRYADYSDGSTFTNLFSGTITDDTFIFRARGKYSHLDGDCIIVNETDDPERCPNTAELKLSLIDLLFN